MTKKREPKKRLLFIICILISLVYLAFMTHQFVSGVTTFQYRGSGGSVAYQAHPIIFYFVLVLQGILPIGIFLIGYGAWWDAKRKDKRDKWLRKIDEQRK